MNEAQRKAYLLAQEAAQLDFRAAVEGLLAGHAAMLVKMQDALAAKDKSFLMALALTERGARLDKAGIMESAIAEGLRGLAPHCKTEVAFLERVGNQAEKDQTDG